MPKHEVASDVGSLFHHWVLGRYGVRSGVHSTFGQILQASGVAPIAMRLLTENGCQPGDQIKGEYCSWVIVLG